jgi:hypothetical protein
MESLGSVHEQCSWRVTNYVFERWHIIVGIGIRIEIIFQSGHRHCIIVDVCTKETLSTKHIVATVVTIPYVVIGDLLLQCS